MDVYPKRPPFFANKFVRLLAKVCAAQEIGPEASFLLTVIAFTEDARGYRSPVTFYNEQLVPMCGFANIRAMMRAREKAIAYGWLEYQPGGKRIPGRYFVIVPPTFKDYDDKPSDEGLFPDYYVENDTASDEEPPTKRQISAQKVSQQTPDKRTESVHLPTYTSPIPIQDKPPSPFDAFWKCYPKRRAKADAMRAWKKINPDDDLLKIILSSIEAQKTTQDWIKDNGKYIPLPATWLNGKRWEDELRPAIDRKLTDYERQHADYDAINGKYILDAIMCREPACKRCLPHRGSKSNPRDPLADGAPIFNRNTENDPK